MYIKIQLTQLIQMQPRMLPKSDHWTHWHSGLSIRSSLSAFNVSVLLLRPKVKEMNETDCDYKQKKKSKKKRKLEDELGNQWKKKEAIGEGQHRAAGNWNFDVEYNDHFETPRVAYQDLLPVIQLAASECKKHLHELVVYDPYYCKGEMKSHLHFLGVKNVINRNQDFYADIESNSVPEYDILITNPPYSGEHKQKLLNYLSCTEKPYCLLLPVYVASKSYWKDFISSEQNKYKAKTADHDASSKANIIHLPAIYLLPSSRYEYNHPEGTGKDTSPFFSCWFIGGNFHSLISVRKEILNPSNNLKRCATVCVSVENLIQRGYISAESVKRKNPRQRKNKLKNKIKP